MLLFVNLFCGLQSIPESAHYDLALYTQDVAGVLARSWMHKMQHFLDLACSHTDLGWNFTVAEITGYREPAELADLLQASGYPKCVYRRGLQIRSLCT